MTQLRAALIGTALVALAGCADSPLGPLDWDLRGGGALDTSDAALQATASRPAPDARGVISYPGYQVAVARSGDTVATVAQRIGTDAGALARYNALPPDAPLRDGEVLALPARVAEPAPVAVAGSPRVIGGSGNIDVTAVATTALDRVDPPAAAPATAPAPAPVQSGPEPRQHTVARGETAFSIARTYNVSAQALADWNGLGPEMAVREGQRLMIPTAAAAPPAPAAAPAVTEPASGRPSPAPLPPSASQPLPDEDPQRTTATPENAPDSPDLGEQRTAASAAQMAMPADGAIIRGYAPGRNEGIDIGAPAGSPVRAAAAGTVAAITQDTNAVPIVVIRHEGGLLTVYAGVDGINVARGDAVTRGQQIGKVRAGDPAFLHFEVRRGVESTDPMAFLQ
jgi:murein DD-endopeptidase MepM/ murein hydrolase activator NlpD